MPKDALEVHHFDVGDADCILVTRWKDDQPWRLLIDGGRASTVNRVKASLKALDATRLDAVLCSHLDDDHAAGLVEIVADPEFEIGQGFMHVVEWHVALNEISTRVKAAAIREEQLITASVDTNGALLTAFLSRGIKPTEPFEGVEFNGFLVCGPSRKYYEALLGKFTSTADLRAIDLLLERERMQKQSSSEGKPLLVNPTETPANNTSTILTYDWRGARLRFTADAGLPAQRQAAAFADRKGRPLESICWMQIPHHGSRSAIDQEQIEFYRPAVAYASAAGGKNPADAVVAGFKACGSQVYCTCGATLRRSFGDAPDRGLVPATPLYHDDWESSAGGRDAIGKCNLGAIRA